MALAAEERARGILELVRRDGFQSIESLAGHLGVTPQTVRRDVLAICRRGLLRRRHGGVEAPEPGENLTYGARQVLNLAAKRAIASMVANHVPNGASLFFGIGTTPEQCALALIDHPGLRVMTNNLNAALALAQRSDCTITIAGGPLRTQDLDVVSSEAQGFFGRFSVDIGIYGVGGVAEDGTLLDFTQDEVEVRQSLMRHCRRNYLVLDHSKFGRGATVRGGHITEASKVFTDLPPPIAIADLLLSHGIQLHVATSVPETEIPRNHQPPTEKAQTW